MFTHFSVVLIFLFYINQPVKKLNQFYFKSGIQRNTF